MKRATSTSHEAPIDVVVVGGGLAGLTCGVALSVRGLQVTVVEADNVLGGRASSFIDAKTGDSVHIGPHIFLNLYPNMFQLLDELGTRNRLVWQSDRRFLTFMEGTRATEIRGSSLPPPYTFLPSLIRDQGLSVGDLLKNWPLVILALSCDEEMVKRLDRFNARDLLLAFGVSQSFIDRFWAFTSFAILNVPLQLCSAGALIRFYRHLIGHSDLQIGFVDGGLGDLYAPQCQQRIEQCGGQVLTGARVNRLLLGDDRESVKGVELVDGRHLRARHVVTALPPTTLRELLPGPWTAPGGEFDYLDAFEPVPYLSQYLWFDRKVTNMQFWARAFTEEDLNCDFYDLSNINRGWSGRNSLITSNIIYSHRAESMADEQIIAETRRELEEQFPEVRAAELVHSRVHRIPMAIHAPLPGTESLRPRTRTQKTGLVLAGDWIQTRFPSSMESACASGWLAADEILALEGRRGDFYCPTPELHPMNRVIHALGTRLPNGKIEPILRQLEEQASEPREQDRKARERRAG